jgi:hypothetical protein
MPLFKRRSATEEPLQLLPDPSRWARRLSIVGVALDEMIHDVRDIVVVAEGDPDDADTIVNLLGYREGVFHSGWASLMYTVNTLRMFHNEPIAPPPLPERNGTGALVSRRPVVKRGFWEARLFGVGVLLDRPGVQLMSPTVIDLETGVIVNALIQIDEIVPGWELRSIHFANDVILEAANEH